MSTSENFGVKKVLPVGRQGFAAILVLGLVLAVFVLSGIFYLKHKSLFTQSNNSQWTTSRTQAKTNDNSSKTAEAIQNKIVAFVLDNSNNSSANYNFSLYDVISKKQTLLNLKNTTPFNLYDDRTCKAALSPNHKFLGFIHGNLNNQELIEYSLNEGTLITTPITGGGMTGCDYFTYSPDGNKVTFLLKRDGIDGSERLYWANSDGSGLTQFATIINGTYDNLVWSPDSKKIIYRTTVGNINPPILLNQYNLETGKAEDITPSDPVAKEVLDLHAFPRLHFIWIDNDHLLSFYCDANYANDRYGIWTFSLSLNQTKQIVPLPSAGSSCGLSEDQKYILSYDSNAKKTTYYALTDKDGSGQKSLSLVASTSGNGGTLSPTGKLIAFQTNLGIWVKELATDKITNILDLKGSQGYADTTSFIWSPDSTQLTFTILLAFGAGGGSNPLSDEVVKSQTGWYISNVNGGGTIKIDQTTRPYGGPLFWY